MKLLIVNCSPVKNGATAEMVNLIRGYAAAAGNTVKCVCIDDFDIKFCRGCRQCHITANCFQADDTKKLMAQYIWADKIVSVSPSYWAGVPGQFKAFIDRCTPWSNTHEPHAAIPRGKYGYVIALRTGSKMAECQKIMDSIEHFYGHLEIKPGGRLGLCAVESKEDVADRTEEIKSFCEEYILAWICPVQGFC